MESSQITLSWKISVPIFGSTVILKQLGFALGIPLGLVVLVIMLTSGRSVYTLYALGLIVALLFFTWLMLMAVYRGRYEVEYVLDDKGVFCHTQEKQAKQNRSINFLTAVLGLISGKPAIAGAGMLAQSRQHQFLKWSSITKIKYKSQQYVILLRSGWLEQTALFCTQDNYAQVKQFVRRKMPQLDEVSKK